MLRAFLPSRVALNKQALQSKDGRAENRLAAQLYYAAQIYYSENPMLMDNIKELLTKEFVTSESESVIVNDLTGTQDHLELIITSTKFSGLPLMGQHQLVMDTLKEKLKSELHAVKIKTQIPS